MSQNEELKVKISLNDRLSSGLTKVGGQLDKLNRSAEAFQQQLRGNFDDMVAGAGSAIAAGMGVVAAISPGLELDRALKGLESSGFEGELAEIRNAAQEFSREFGVSSAEFVQQAELVRRAVGDVNGAELSQITAATAKLAAATGSDVQAVSKYLGRLYHAYQDEADKIGKVDFISAMANANAVASRHFGVSADEMAGAMESISSLAKNYDIALPEQIAVIGALQVEHSESDASSFYEAFIREGSALAELGIDTLDAEGKMRPILDILDQVQAKFGDLDANEFELLDEKGGDAAMVIQTLLRQQDKLKAALGEMATPGTAALDKLADGQTDAIKRLTGSWMTMQENLAAAVMPVVNTVSSALAGLIDGVSHLASEFPGLTSFVLSAAVGLTVLTGIISAGSAVFALLRTGTAALSPVMLLTSTSTTALTSAIRGYTVASMLSATKTQLQTAATWASTVSTRVLSAAFGQLKGMLVTISNGYTAMTRTMQGLTLASLRQAAVTKVLAAGQAMLNLVMGLNPVGLLIGALAVGAVMVMRYWQPISAFFSGFVDGLKASGLFEAFAPLVAVFSWIWSKVSAIGSLLFGWLTPIQSSGDELAEFANTGLMVGTMVGNFFAAIGDNLMTLFSGVIGLLNKIPGIDIELPELASELLAIEPAPSLQSTSEPIVNVAPLLEITTSQLAIERQAPSMVDLNMPTIEQAQTSLASHQSLTKPVAPAPVPVAQVIAQATGGNQQSQSVQTGDIHIHQPMPSFSLLGLDEQRLLTIG
ncbi:phage tail tape measure protein [Ferrimonas senticii]|uniref:phage tail tape measure protein n=1 Tax=Ferrimonas senticii TaxID=394566 RepID=UPI0003FA9E02|nr:phage tail tape measure protein [Ferrimonas senticii]